MGFVGTAQWALVVATAAASNMVAEEVSMGFAGTVQWALVATAAASNTEEGEEVSMGSSGIEGSRSNSSCQWKRGSSSRPSCGGNNSSNWIWNSRNRSAGTSSSRWRWRSTY